MRSDAKAVGFTLIELVVVITILAILAAFAVPRFASLEVETRAASMRALAGSIRSGSALSHALWLAQGQPETVSMQGASITMKHGYPSLDTIDDTLSETSGFTYSADTGTFSRTGSTPNCSVTYAEAASVGEAPSVSINVSGC